MGSKKPLNTGFVARRERGTDKYWVGSIPIQIVSKFTLFFSKPKKTIFHLNFYFLGRLKLDMGYLS